MLEAGIAPDPPPFSALEMNEMLWTDIEPHTVMRVGRTKLLRIPGLDQANTLAYTRMTMHDGRAVRFTFEMVESNCYVRVEAIAVGRATIRTHAEWSATGDRVPGTDTIEQTIVAI